MPDSFIESDTGFPCYHQRSIQITVTRWYNYSTTYLGMITRFASHGITFISMIPTASDGDPDVLQANFDDYIVANGGTHLDETIEDDCGSALIPSYPTGEWTAKLIETLQNAIFTTATQTSVQFSIGGLEASWTDHTVDNPQGKMCAGFMLWLACGMMQLRAAIEFGNLIGIDYRGRHDTHGL